MLGCLKGKAREAGRFLVGQEKISDSGTQCDVNLMPREKTNWID